MVPYLKDFKEKQTNKPIEEGVGREIYGDKTFRGKFYNKRTTM